MSYHSKNWDQRFSQHAFLYGTETELLLKSRRVVPGRLDAAGFTFQFPDWENAAVDLCRRIIPRGQQNARPQ